MKHCLYCYAEIGFESVWSKWLKPYAEVCETCKSQFQRIEGKVCLKCGRPYDVNWFTGTEMVCHDCKEMWADTRFIKNTSLFLYDEAGQAWMAKFKFRGDVVLAQMFEAEIRAFWKRNQKNIDAIVVVPLSTERQQERRFNQAQVFAEMMEHRKILTIFQKHHQSKQSKLGKYGRLHRENPFFFLENQENLHYFPKNVLIVDDIYTTGTTIHQICELIWQKSSSKIYSFTLFRASSIKK